VNKLVRSTLVPLSVSPQGITETGVLARLSSKLERSREEATIWSIPFLPWGERVRDWGIFSANFKTSSLNLILAHHSTIKLNTSIFLSHFFQMISFIVHSGFFPVQSVTSTQTMSQALASILFFPATNISVFTDGLLGITNQYVSVLPGLNSQTISSSFLSNTRTIVASCLPLNIFTLASTLSQSRAEFLLCENTKYPLSTPSTSINQKSHFHCENIQTILFSSNFLFKSTLLTNFNSSFSSIFLSDFLLISFLSGILLSDFLLSKDLLIVFSLYLLLSLKVFLNIFTIFASLLFHLLFISNASTKSPVCASILFLSATKKSLL
jgi:hypothetical protein